MLGVIGSGLMIVASVLSVMSDVMYLSPARAVLMAYACSGGVALLALEGAQRLLFARSMRTLRIYLHQELHFLATATGRALAYAFFGSLLLADATYASKIVGVYVLCLACAMVFLAQRASKALAAMGAGLSEADLLRRFDAFDKDADGKLSKSDLAALCDDLHTPLTTRELEAAFNLLDTDHSNTIDKHEFLTWYNNDNWQRSLLAMPSLPSYHHHQHKSRNDTNHHTTQALSDVVEMM